MSKIEATKIRFLRTVMGSDTRDKMRETEMSEYR
jgi:hypothetical protein